jgi:hypothetical protein
VRITTLPPESPRPAKLLLDDPTMVTKAPDEFPLAPNTFAVRGDTITIDDPVHHRIGIYRNGKRVKSLAWPDSDCLDMVVDGDHYWFLGTDETGDKYEVFDYLLKPGATHLTLVTTYPVPGDDMNPPTWLTREGQNIVLQDSDNKLDLVAGPGPLTPAGKITVGKYVARIRNGLVTTEITTRRRAGWPDLLARTDQYDYFWITDDGPTEWIYRLTKTGELAGTYTLLRITDSRPFLHEVQIGPDGQVYQLVVTDKSVRVYLIAPNP